jgi:hypothetical protein
MWLSFESNGLSERKKEADAQHMERVASQEEVRRGCKAGLRLGAAEDNPTGEVGCSRGGAKDWNEMNSKGKSKKTDRLAKGKPR